MSWPKEGELRFDPSIHQKRLLKEWKKFVDSGKIESDIVPAHIAESWQRSRDLRIDPYHFSPAAYLDPEVYRRKKAENQYLLSLAAPLMERVYHSLEKSRYLVVLYNADGYHLMRMGQVADFERSTKFSITEGLCFAEDKMGTCGFSLAKDLKRPIQITGCEHYCALLHYVVGSYAPVYDPSNGNLVGVFGITGARTMPNLHTLGMAIAASSAVENYIKLDRSRKVFFIYGKALQTMMDSLSDGVILVDKDGSIYEINTVARSIFGLETDTKGKHLSEISQLADLHKFFTRVLANPDREEQEMDIEIRDEIYVTTIRFLQETKDGEPGFMFQLKNLKDLSQIVHKRDAGASKLFFSTMIGSHPVMAKIKNLGKLATKSESNIIIEGESGTGKEVLAQVIHNESTRRNQPFVIINCSAIPSELMESTLFGHEKGAFTGAGHTHIGKFELADKGTVFLDEIAEMPTNMQAKLLRVLEEKTIERIGGKKHIKVDIRVIAATNRDLMKEVKENRFREDLFYRLNVFRIKLPPLRERKSDIYELVQSFVQQFSKLSGKEVKNISEDYYKVLFSYDWPGNIRELRNAVQYSMAVVEGPTLSGTHLSGFFSQGTAEAGEVGAATGTDNLPLNLTRLEEDAIRRVLKETNGNKVRTAKLLGVSRATIYRKLKKLS